MNHWRAGLITARGGRRLYVRTLDGKMHESARGGSIQREGGWIYGHDDRYDWAVPESSVSSITEA